MVSTNDRNRLRPNIEWLGRQMPNEDMVHGTYMPGPMAAWARPALRRGGIGGGRAAGWAATSFRGRCPRSCYHLARPLEADTRVDKQWNEAAVRRAG
jgi:hypothetical protein